MSSATYVSRDIISLTQSLSLFIIAVFCMMTLQSGKKDRLIIWEGGGY